MLTLAVSQPAVQGHVPSLSFIFLFRSLLSFRVILVGITACNLVDVFIGAVTGRKLVTEAAKDKKEDNEDSGEDDDLSEGRVTDTVISPGTTTSTSVFLELVCSKLVVYETTKSNRVAEELQRRDGVAEDEHRSENEEDILEHTGKCEDERGGSANL